MQQETWTPTQDGVRGAAKEVVEQAETVARVARGELEQNARELGVGAGFGAGGAVLAVYGVGFLLAAIAVALALVMPTWLALLIVALMLFAATAVLGLLARRQFQKGSPLVPEHVVPDAQRQRLVLAVAHFRRELARTTKAKTRVPAAAAALGFVAGGGLSALVRLTRRR